MSIELKQAAQDAAEAIDWLLKNIRLDAPQLSGKAMGNAEKCASTLRAAIQQAEAQQAEGGEPYYGHQFREIRKGVWLCKCGKQITEGTTSCTNGTPNTSTQRQTADAVNATLTHAASCCAPRAQGWSIREGSSQSDTPPAIQQVEAQQPATPEPVVEPTALYNKVESKIVQRYVVEKRTGGGFWPDCVRARGGECEIFVGHKAACENVRAALQTACLDGAFMADIAARSQPAPSVLKDDQIAALVNKVRDIARMFHDHQSLRERIAIELVPALKVSQEVKSNAERWRYAIADSGNQTMNFIDIFDDWDGDGSFVEAFDKARLADKKEGSAA